MRLIEGGIYQLWVKWTIYNWRDFDVEEPLVAYDTALMSAFAGPSLLCASLISMSFGVFCLELAICFFPQFAFYLVIRWPLFKQNFEIAALSLLRLLTWSSLKQEFKTILRIIKRALPSDRVLPF